jgi:LPXTG-motif cell wall-anchored protein
MRFIQSICYMLLTMVALAIGAAFLISSANTSTAVAATDQCVAPCTVDQGIGVTILPPGVPPTTPPVTPPVTPPPTTAPDDGDQGGDGTGKTPTNAGGTTKLPKTGPKETAIMAAVGAVVLQVGMIFTVRSARAARRVA